jgi:hypothetical protein
MGQQEVAGVLKNDIAVAFEMLIEHDASSRKLHSKSASLLSGPYDFRGGSLDLQRVTFRP